MGKQSRKKRSPKKSAKKNQNKNRLIVLGAIGGLTLLVLAVLIGVTVTRNSSSTERGPVVGAPDVASLLDGIPQQNNVLGQPNAPVTMIEFADLKCPTCQKYTVNTMPRIINDYVRTGKLRIVLQLQTFVGRKTTPGDSERGARFALAAGKQNKLWNFIDLFYHNQPPEEETYFTDEFITSLGNEVTGLNVQQAFSQTDADDVSREIDDQLKAFNDSKFDGVPSFQIGKTGATPSNLTSTSIEYGIFKSAIDNLL